MSVQAELLLEPSIRAFLRMVRWCEGTAGPNGYRTLFGGDLFEGFADHPRIAKRFTDKRGRRLWTSAAGAYQWMAVSPLPTGGSTRVNTWDRIKAKLNLPDFSPRSQDMGAVELVRECKAIDDILEGRIEQAITKCRGVWASLPGAGYAQPERSMADCLLRFRRYLFEESAKEPAQTPAPAPVPLPPPPPPAPAPEPAPTIWTGETTPPPAPSGEWSGEVPAYTPRAAAKEGAMSPFIPIAFQALTEIVPKLVERFGSGSDVAQRNAAAAVAVVETAKRAIGAVSEQQLVEAVKADPQAAQSVRTAIQADWFNLTATPLENLAAAREQVKIYLDPNSRGFWWAPQFWVTMLVLPAGYMILADMMWLNRAGYSRDMVSMVIGLVLGVAFTKTVEYWHGTSASSAKKDQMLIDKAEGR